MSDQFLAEIRIFPFNFPPTGWAYCDGQLMPISQNTALFALLGTFYGGDGRATYALPDMQGSVPMQTGQGQGLAERFLGEASGVESVTLLVSEIPLHTHTMRAQVGEPADLGGPGGSSSASLSRSSKGFAYGTAGDPGGAQVPLAFQALVPAGGGLPHNNMQPYLTLNFCIALQGIFPQRP